MAGALRKLTLRASELQRYRAAVIDCTGPEERERMRSELFRRRARR